MAIVVKYGQLFLGQFGVLKRAVALFRPSSTPPPFGLTDAQLFEERTDGPVIVLDRSFEVFRLLAEPLHTHQQVVRLARGGR